MKDRRWVVELERERVEILYERSSAHPLEYAIVLRVRRQGRWFAVRTFDNAHTPEEHHEHAYVRDEKQTPAVAHGPVNDGMHAAEFKVRANWRDIVSDWEKTWEI